MWSPEAMENALKAVERGSSVRKAAERFGIPRATLHDRMKIPSDSATSPSSPPKLGRYTVLSAEAEKDLAGRILHLADVFYGVDEQKIRSVAYEFATRQRLKHHFDSKKRMAGKDWLAGFLKRHPEISVRKAESTSIQRLEAQNKQNVNKMYSNLSKVFSKHGSYPPYRIYNVDETGVVPVVENKRILARTGQRKVGRVSSAERGAT